MTFSCLVWDDCQLFARNKLGMVRLGLQQSAHIVNEVSHNVAFKFHTLCGYLHFYQSAENGIVVHAWGSAGGDVACLFGK